MAINAFIPEIPVCDWTAILVVRPRHPLGGPLLSRRSARGFPRLWGKKAVPAMVVHHPHGLQKRIDNRAADEAKTALLEVFRDQVAQLRAGREAFGAWPNSYDRLAVYEIPPGTIERAELFLQL